VNATASVCVITTALPTAIYLCLPVNIGSVFGIDIRVATVNSAALLTSQDLQMETVGSDEENTLFCYSNCDMRVKMATVATVATSSLTRVRE
jgi:hypothetical protein